MKIENFVTLRYILKGRKNKDFNHAAIIVVLSIAFAIIVYISAVSIMNGYYDGITKLICNVKSFHVELSTTKSLDLAEQTKEFLALDKRVQYIGLYQETSGLFSVKGKITGLKYIRSMPEDIFLQDPDFNRGIELINGKKSLLKDELMISQKTAEKLRIKVGDSVYFTGIFSSDNNKYVFKKLRVSGIFTTGLVDFDEHFAVMGNKTGDLIFKDRLYYNVFIRLKDHKLVNDFVDWGNTFGYFGMITWIDANYNQITSIRFERNIIALIVFIVIIIAALNILTTIHLSIQQKTEDIAILKSLGFSPAKICVIFLLQGVYLGIIGITLGTTIGLWIMNNLNNLVNGFAVFLNNIQGFIYFLIHSVLKITMDPPQAIEFFSKDFYLNKIYSSISLGEIIIISFLTLIFAIFVSLLPAIQAGKIKPNEVLKNG
ncbi:MAG: FtsX-like permease family protein [Spirochaetes bacterium]|nr:FtsX-like permease family protein [Spirochaetota bacterium]